MNKYVKNFITVCMAVCMVVCLCLFASACGEDKNHYVVNVEMPDGSAAANIRVEFCAMDGTNLNCLFESTDKNGKATFDIRNFSDTTYFVMHLPEVPEGTMFDANDDNKGGMYVYVKNGYSITIKLKAKSTADVPTCLV